MPLTPTEALEILSAELAHNVSRTLPTVAFLALEKRRHLVHLVLREIIPVLAVDTALLAIVVLRRVKLVALHFLLCVEGLGTAIVGALEALERRELGRHPECRQVGI